jgi:hypothetical protein
LAQLGSHPCQERARYPRSASRLPRCWRSIPPRPCLPLNGKIDLVQIDLGDDNHDHLINAEQLIRIAMARQ